MRNFDKSYVCVVYIYPVPVHSVLSVTFVVGIIVCILFIGACCYHPGEPVFHDAMKVS